MLRPQYSYRSSVDEETTSSGPSFIDILKRLSSTNLNKQHYLSSLNELSRLCRSKTKRDELFQTIHNKTIPIATTLTTNQPRSTTSTSTNITNTSTTSTDTNDINQPQQQPPPPPPQQQQQITLDDVFRCLKSALFHEAAEVRAAALRAIRYLLKDEQAVESLFRVDLPIFIVRSIDIVLENRLERIQALRLVRKFLSISPHLFPAAFTRSLIAIAQDGQVEHDTLTRACWALLAELSIMSPISSTRDTQNCAFNAIMDAALAGNQPHGISESLISTLLYMLNWPRYRCLIRGDLDLQIFVAPFTDSHYTAPVSKDQKQRINQAAKFEIDPYDQRENKFIAAKITLISILRSWQGLIYLCEPQSSECNLVSNSCLKSLINMLYLPYNDVRKRLIDLIFELLYLPLPDSLSDFETGLKYLEKHQLSMDSWKIHDAFVVDEAKAILPPLRSRSRMNLVNDYLALLLVTLFHCNVVDALSEVIITPSNQENSTRATILLYQLLSLSYQYLPTDSFSQYLTLSTLISHATSKVDDSRDLANAALINLGRVHPLKKSSNFTNTRCSIFLSQILEFCSPHLVTSNNGGGVNLGINNCSGNNNLNHQNVNFNTATNHLDTNQINTNNNNTGNNIIRNSPSSCGISTTSTMTSISSAASQRTNDSSSSSTSTLVNANPRRPPSRSASISSRTVSILSRSSSVSAATSQLLTLLSLSSSTKSSLKMIIEQDWQAWDWEHINFILTRPNDAMKRLSSQYYKAFIKRLVHFFKPSSNQYSMIDINNERCRQLCETGCNMVDFLVESPEPKATELLRELLHDISISMHDPESNGANHAMNTHTMNNINAHNFNGKTKTTTTTTTMGNGNTLGSVGGAGGTMTSHSFGQFHHPEVNILSSSKLITTMSSTYFLFIGRLSGTMRGFQMLERSSIMKLINNLTQTSMYATSPAEVYVRLIISCFDYTKQFNGSRQLLEKFLFHHPEENVRIYATNFLRVLLRANVPDFAAWAVRLLVRQLNSSLRVVQHAAADILDEACDLDENLEGLIELKNIVVDDSDPGKIETKSVLDILRSTGHSGYLLLCRFASSTNGLRFLLESPTNRLSCPLDSVLSPSPNMNVRFDNTISHPDRDSNSPSDEDDEDKKANEVNHYHPNVASESIIKVESEFDVELDRWQRVFNYRYVKIVEDVLNNSLTYHQKGEDGKYGRRIDKINPMTKNSLLPPHLYGQLALHPEGIEIIQSRRLMDKVYDMLKHPPSDLNYSEVSVLKFKAALWIVGNVGSSDSGFQVLENSRELIKLIHEIAKNASVLSLRGTAFYVLGLLGSTEEGAEEMKEHGWIVQKNNKVALPLDLGLILTKPQDEADNLLMTEPNSPASGQSSPDGQPGSNLSQDMAPSSSSLLLDGATKSADSINREANDSGNVSSMSESAANQQATTTTSSSSIPMTYVSPKLEETFSRTQLDQIRKDILKHVTNLSHSVASRPAENSLLNLKRKYGLVFQHDLALYSEVCNQLARYNFRLHARRFLQELFLDIT